MKQQILLGFEVKTGKPVHVPLHHLICTGMTQLSGKTTTLEALLSRSKLTALTFRTKRGELGFEEAREVPAYFDEKGLTHWRALEGLLASVLDEKVQREPGVRSAIMHLTEGEPSLEEVHRRAKKAATGAARAFDRDVYNKIDHYLELVLPQLRQLQFEKTLVLRDGLHMMNLEGMTDEMQTLVIFATITYVSRNYEKTVIVMPEAWRFIPQDRGNPCKPATERFIREGAVIGNYLWIDSQDLRGVDKKFLRHIDNWILGRQRDPREIESTLAAIPLAKRLKPAPEEIMQLDVGHFIACLHDDVKRVYVMPGWLNEGQARNVALGQMKLVPRPLPGPGVVEHMEVSRVSVPMHPQEQSIAYRELTQKVEGLKEDLAMFGEQMRVMERSVLKAMHQTIEAFKEDYDAKLRALALHPPVGEVTATYPSGGSIEKVEEVWHISHRETEAKLSTATQKGQVMYALVNDLEGKPSTIAQIAAAMVEYGWNLTSDVIRLNLLKLSKEGLVVPPSPGRPAGTGPTYRTPRNVKVTVEKK